MTEIELQRTVAAHHEAAHAVARVRLGANVGRTWIDASGLGMSEGFGYFPSAEVMARVSMVGPAVENRYRALTLEERIEMWTGALLCEEEHDSSEPMRFGLAVEAYLWAIPWVDEHWPEIERVAAQLLEVGSLEPDELMLLLR